MYTEDGHGSERVKKPSDYSNQSLKKNTYRIFKNQNI